MPKKLLLIVDPQNDFVDPKGSLYVNGGDKAVENIISFVKNTKEDIDIILTQDSHYRYNLGHACFWKTEDKLQEFQKIMAEDIEKGRCVPCFGNNADSGHTELLVNQAKSNGGITIWPEHCILGSWGWAFPDSLIKALNDRQIDYGLQKSYGILQKGLNPYVECFSMFTNDYPVNLFSGYDEIYVAGVAKDVCVARTVRDMIFSSMYENKLVFLDSCMATIDESAESLKIFKEAVEYHGARVVE